ncbi:MAG TPA: M67 family metallopeptidase [Terracidiphilus sp.]|nr:M67 family metallopeptidase [Terracidiphilus sp.]
MSRLSLPRPIHDAIRTHGEKTYPHECCGALLGRFSPADEARNEPAGWLVEAAVPAGNTRTDSAHNRYQIAPVELVKIEREARSRGLDIAGFYHSHPDHPAQWSPTDFAEAHWLGCCYVITSVAQGRATITNSFLLAGLTEEDKHFEQQTIQITDPAAD